MGTFFAGLYTFVAFVAAVTAQATIEQDNTGALVMTGRDVFVRNTDKSVDYSLSDLKWVTDRTAAQTDMHHDNVTCLSKAIGDKDCGLLHGSLFDRVARLDDAVAKADHSERIEKLENDNEMLKTNVSDLKEMLASQKNHSEKQTEDIKDLQSRLDDAEDDNDSLRRNISELKTMLGLAEARTDRLVKIIDDRLDDITAHLKLPRRVHYDFEEVFANGVAYNIREGFWVHFGNNGNSPLPSNVKISIPPWTSTIADNGVFNPPNNEIKLFDGTPGRHTLFVNSGEVFTTTDIVLQKNQNFTVTANVGGGNRNLDGGYKISFETEDNKYEVATPLEPGVDGAPDTTNDGKYVSVQYSFDTKDLPSEHAGKYLRIILSQSKPQQAHFHFIDVEMRQLF